MPDEYRLLGTETWSLPCRLTEEELLEHGHQAATLHAQSAELDARRESEQKRFKGEIAALDNRRNLLLAEMKDKQQKRPVEVQMRLDLDAHTVETIREDTGVIVHSRRASKEELQGKLFPIAGEQSAQL